MNEIYLTGAINCFETGAWWGHADAVCDEVFWHAKEWHDEDDRQFYSKEGVNDSWFLLMLGEELSYEGK
jgi:hypothetical protein